jgi:hypothetical protein
VCSSDLDVNEFKFTGSKYFISREVNGKKIFLEFLIKGKVNIFAHKDQRGDHFFIEKEGLGISELPYEEGILYKDNIPFEFRSTTFIGILNIYMQDAPEFQSRIASMNKPNQRWLIELAEDYHNTLCKTERCIIFEKQLPFLKVNLEFLIGANSFSNSSYTMGEYYYYLNKEVNKNNYFQAGVIANFWLPRVNEKLFLRTGVLFSTFNSNNDSKKFYKIPIQIEYIYPKGTVRPKLAYGINLYKPFNYTIAITPGINIRLEKSVFIEISYNADFMPSYKMPLFPEKIYSYGILAGIYISL